MLIKTSNIIPIEDYNAENKHFMKNRAALVECSKSNILDMQEWIENNIDGLVLFSLSFCGYNTGEEFNGSFYFENRQEKQSFIDKWL